MSYFVFGAAYCTVILFCIFMHGLLVGVKNTDEGYDLFVYVFWPLLLLIGFSYKLVEWSYDLGLFFRKNWWKNKISSPFPKKDSH